MLDALTRPGTPAARHAARTPASRVRTGARRGRCGCGGIRREVLRVGVVVLPGRAPVRRDEARSATGRPSGCGGCGGPRRAAAAAAAHAGSPAGAARGSRVRAADPRRSEAKCPPIEHRLERTDGCAALRQLALHLRLGEEDAAAQERDVHPAVLRGRSFRRALQLLGLLVGQRQRVVEGAAALAGQRPCEALVAQPTAVVLDLDQEEAGRGDDQQVDLADVALVGDEGEVRPGLERVRSGSRSRT